MKAGCHIAESRLAAMPGRGAAFRSPEAEIYISILLFDLVFFHLVVQQATIDL